MEKFDMKWVDWNCDGGYVNFVKKNREENISYASIALRYFDLRDVQKPRTFTKLSSYKLERGGRISAHYLNYHCILLINQFDDHILFTSYDIVKDKCLREFQIRVQKKDYKIKFDRRQVFAYPKEGRKGRSYMFDFNYMY